MPQVYVGNHLKKGNDMNTYASPTNLRGYLAIQFSNLRMRAVRDALWAKLIRKDTRLAAFPAQAPQKSPNRKFRGTEDIRVDQVVGTLGRHTDFDHKFRPLKPYLRDRWINAYLALEREGWSPIVVHRVGEHYYVEDGHHRVSVARLLGMVFIEAKVWEYPVNAKPPRKCQAVRCPERSTVKAYAAR
jgi:hypothetical protein